MGDRLLTIEEYDARERDARAKASYPAIRAFSPRAFNDVNFPARVSKEEELRRYADIMYELLARTPLLEHPLYSETEARAISRLSDQIRTLTVERFGRPVRPLMCLFAPMALLRAIETMAAMRQRRLRVYEIGPGSGYLGAYLLNAGHSYAAMEVCQALYLWQNRLMAAIAADFSEGARFEEPPPCFAHQATHVPWWHFARLHEGQPEPADVVVCDAAMGEMDAFALPYVLRIARAMLATSDGGALLFQNVGEERFHSRTQVCSMLAALGFRHRTIGGVTVASCAGEPLPPGLSDLARLGGPSERVLAAREFLAIEESELLESYRFFDFIGSLPPYPVDLQAAPRRPDPATA
ncbi:MAG TPA: hypothetical protein VNK52_12335 [Hyphomicrobiaceae bacterium]|nr:hypothetical protein [Hyphomicrobiaceae bacterium]